MGERPSILSSNGHLSVTGQEHFNEISGKVLNVTFEFTTAFNAVAVSSALVVIQSPSLVHLWESKPMYRYH
jgi:hypothetical protein